MINTKYRTLKEPQTPIEAVALGLVLAVTAPTRNKALKATFLAEEIASDAKLTTEDVDCAKAIASRWLDDHYYEWGGKDNE